MRSLPLILSAVVLATLFGCGSSHAPISTDSSTSTGTVVVPVPPPVPVPVTTGLTPEQKAQWITMIQSAGALAVDAALTEWSKSNNALATTVATGLHNNIQAIALPVLNGQSVKPSDALTALTSSFGSNLPPLIKVGIQAGSSILDQVFSIPGVKDSDKIDFIKAFATAVDNGCLGYLAAPPKIGKSMIKHVVEAQ